MDSYLFLDKEELKRLYYVEGLTHEQIAERLYCSVSTVRKYMRMYGMTGRKAKERRPLARYEVRGEMLTAQEIADRAKVSISTIRSRISRGWSGEELLLGREAAFAYGGMKRRKYEK